MDGLRFAVGTLSVFPVRVSRVDRQIARAGMLWAPAVGVLIGLLQSGLLIAVQSLTGEALLAAALTVAFGGLVTRGLHLDGLADVADGLGSGRPAEGALEIMKRSDIGPFGVVTLMFTLMIQVTALAAAGGRGLGCPAIVVAATTGRLVLPWACRRGVPAARPEGLGAMVAGTVPWPAAAAVTVAVLGGSLILGRFALSPALGLVAGSASLPMAVLAGLAAAGSLRRRLLNRLGGVTGDVLGALLETATTATLLVTVLLVTVLPGNQAI